MAASTIWGQISATPASADYEGEILNENNGMRPQVELVDDGLRSQVIHRADDGSRTTVDFGDTYPTFTISVQWPMLSATNAGTLFDLYHDANKAKQFARSFYFQHPDGYTYTVKFASPLPRAMKPGVRQGFTKIKLEVIARSPV